jgi:L-lactate dehydrogenase (cytochrome)
MGRRRWRRMGVSPAEAVRLFVLVLMPPAIRHFRSSSVTDFLDLHPGGSKIILQHSGKDVTALYNPLHPPNTIQNTLDPSKRVGKLDPAATDSVRIKKSSEETEDDERVRQARGELGHIDAEVVNISDFEVRAN